MVVSMNSKPIKKFTLAAMIFVCCTSAHAAGADALMKYCKPDVERLCNGIEPGGGRLLQCLKGHKEEMSVGCAMALKKLKSKMAN